MSETEQTPPVEDLALLDAAAAGTLLDLAGAPDLTPAAVPRFAPSFAVEDVDRFWSYVLRGPERDDCWFWTGAIADDGYGRFWTADPTRSSGQHVHRPHRFAYVLATGDRLTPDELLCHGCDIPLCVRVATEHVGLGDQRTNMLERTRRGRHASGSTIWRWRGISRAQRVARSRELRQVLRTHGWDRDRIHAVLTGQDSNTPTLW